MIQEEYFGFNSIINLKNILSKHNPRNIFLVTGRNSYEKCGAKPILENLLKNYSITHFFDFEVNPKLKDIETGIAIFKKNNCDFVMAVGGGSVMDVAKSINILSVNKNNSIGYITNKNNIGHKGKTLVAIPTTSGSGSEATKFAVVYIDRMKYSLDNEFMLPDYAIVDPQFTMSLPRAITASTGMDAFCQAVESYWSINSTEESKKYAREAIILAFNNLPKAAKDPDKKSREAMSKAAHLAGKAINISKTTACHAISYPITSYFNVPHGHAVALTIHSMIKFNSDVNENDISDKRGVNYVKKTIRKISGILGCKNAEEAAGKITHLMQETGLKTRLSELGIKTPEDIKIIIKNGFNQGRVKNNPRKLTEEALRRILGKIR